jgi:predicted AlkP superfamily phosphohydrolase/phosphomutase
MTVYADPHDVGHQCWHLHDPSHVNHDADLAKTIGDPIKNTYMAIDKSIERLVQAVGSDATIIVFTGPGMGPGYTGSVWLDQILRRIEGATSTDGLTYVDTLKSVYRSVVPSSIRNHLRSRAERSEEAMLASDRSRRKCFVVPHNENSGAIRINLVGREPNGKVNPGPEAEAFCDALIKDLMDIVKLDTGEPLVDEVVRVSERFEGEHLDELPDLLVIWNRKTPITSFGSAKIGKIEAKYPGNRTGDHTPRGLFFASGPGISPCALSNEVSVMDVGTTIMSWLDLTLLDMDGAPIPALCEGKQFSANFE